MRPNVEVSQPVTPTVARVCGSNSTWIGVSARARKCSATRAMLTFALSVTWGSNTAIARANRDRHGSVANSG